MLDQIPQELLVLISSHLTLPDKLRLIATCRRLFNVITNANLYSELDLLNHTHQVEAILGMFINNRYPGIQVKRLSFDTKRVSDELLLRLPATFPNVTRFRTQKYNNGWMRSRGGVFPETAAQWSNTLDTYNSQFDWCEILPVLKTTVFPQLTVLTLGNTCKQEDKMEGFDIPYFLPHIRNAPALRKLTLTNCAVDLDFLEEIHVSCPHLRSLELCNTHIIIKSDTSLPSITPANSLLHLNLDDNVIFDVNGVLLDYITTKYQQLKELVFTFDDEYSADDFNEYYGIDDVDLFTDSEGDDDEEEGIGGPEFREYNLIYSALKREFERTLVAYKESGPKFFSNINPKLNLLSIINDCFERTLQALSHSETQLFNLIYCNTLQTADSLQSISNIGSLKVLDITVKFPSEMDIPVIPSPNIALLTFSNSGKSIDFDWLSSSFPSVKELDLDGPFTWDKSNNDTIPKLPHLLKLCTNCSSLDQKCFDFFTIHAPNIKILDLNLQLTMPITLDISNWELKKMRLLLNMFRRSYYFEITTPHANEVLKLNSVDGTVALIANRAEEFSDAAPPMIQIKSINDKCFMFFKYNLSLTQNHIVLSN